MSSTIFMKMRSPVVGQNKRVKVVNGITSKSLVVKVESMLNSIIYRRIFADVIVFIFAH